MRVNYLHQYFTLPSGSGGTRSYEFARRWIANGKQVRIITSNAKLPSDFRGISQTIRTEVEGIPVSIIPSNYSQDMTYAERIRAFMSFALAASLETLRQPADVIYATSTPLTIAIPGIMGKLTQRIPLVMEIRDLWPEIPIAMGALKNPLFRYLAHALEWSAYHSSAHIVALSPHMAQGVIRRGIPSERVTIVPNSSDVEFFSVAANTGQTVREKLGLTSNQPLIVYTGTFGYVNGVTYLVDIAAHLRQIAPEAHLLLVGQGVESEQIRQRASDCGLLDQTIHIWDPVPKTEIPAILEAATIATSTVIPREPLWNNSANKFFDALAAGRPIAINHGGWLADLIVETDCGVVLPSADPQSAAQELNAFFSDSNRIMQARQQATNLAQERFDRDILSQQVEAILMSVAGE